MAHDRKISRFFPNWDEMMGDHTPPHPWKRMTLAALLLCSNPPISNSCIPKLIRARILELSVSVATSPPSLNAFTG